ncbi:zinc-binding dehydrogenase [Marininema mesophilum]|uniref:L-erythro-3,5-diaminohexanoate dehydrogenase n=1 Tax=Marininema mesophilum TaxID=1048340 RepID=UPI000B8756B8|nr:zinc-binding dehydrogenase [Marininema mesophilum]
MVSNEKQGHRFGLHRVVEPKGLLPQPAWKLDADPICLDNEMLIDVSCLNIDSASFNQLKESCEQDPSQIRERVLEIVRERGKMHNPVTGSGGMLIGRVEEIGAGFPSEGIQVGDRVATLVSLTLTPLLLEEIEEINMKTGQIHIRGKAILFASGPFAVLPEDLPETLSLAVLDVCGAPAQTDRLVKEGDTVVILGAGGKSGLLSLCRARMKAGASGRVIALESNEAACTQIEELGWADHVAQVDARNPVAVLEAVEKLTNGELADLTVNCVNVPDTELSAILATREQGIAYFFSTAVKFTSAALGAEGLGKDVRMEIGNGFAPGHAELTLDTVRRFSSLRRLFEARYAATTHM